MLASPPSTHRPLAELALAGGCHAIVEMPLALTLPDAAAVANAADAAGRYALARSTEERRPVRFDEGARSMKVGLFLALYSDRTLEEALDAAVAAGCEAVEIIGEGHPVGFWRELVKALRDVGYDGALSIEHEDPLLSGEEGLAVAVETLRAALEPAQVTA